MQTTRSGTGRFTYAVRVGASQIGGIFTLNAMHTATVGALSITEDADHRLAIAYTGGGNLTGNLRQSPTSAAPRQLNVAFAGAAPISLRGGGYLRAYVRAMSKVNILGVLPDGRTFVTVSTVADNGSISFYIPVAKTLATTIGGELTLGDLTATDCTGELEWNRNGALTTLTVNGSFYSAGTTLPSGACTLTLTGADLASTIQGNSRKLSECRRKWLGRPAQVGRAPSWARRPCHCRWCLA